MPDALLLAIAVAGVVLWVAAARQVGLHRRGRFVWAFAFPMLLVPVMAGWAGVQSLVHGQPLGVFLIAFGVALGAVDVRFFRRASRTVAATRPGEDLSGALIEPMSDYALITTVGGLFVAIALGIVFVAWAVLTRSP